MIIETFGAPKPPGRLQRRTRAVEPDEGDDSVPVTRATVALPERFDREDQAEDWLEATSGDSEARGAEVRSTVRLLNRALHALRTGARDPLVQDVGATRALAIRIGFGTGDELADGRWQQARELTPPRRGRLEDIDPQTKVAAVLAGREEVHPAETLLERARLDIEQGRVDEARYGLDAAALALDELPSDDIERIAKRIAEARERLARVDQ